MEIYFASKTHAKKKTGRFWRFDIRCILLILMVLFLLFVTVVDFVVVVVVFVVVIVVVVVVVVVIVVAFSIFPKKAFHEFENEKRSVLP